MNGRHARLRDEVATGLPATSSLVGLHSLRELVPPYGCLARSPNFAARFGI
jgi:hypothetical protein